MVCWLWFFSRLWPFRRHHSNKAVRAILMFRHHHWSRKTMNLNLGQFVDGFIEYLDSLNRITTNHGTPTLSFPDASVCTLVVNPDGTFRVTSVAAGSAVLSLDVVDTAGNHLTDSVTVVVAAPPAVSAKIKFGAPQG